MRLYLSAPLFSQVQRTWNRSFAQALESLDPGTTVCLPQDFRAGGRYNDPKHYPVIFRRCLQSLADAEAVVAILDGSDVDSGVAFEVGRAYALGKPVVGIRTDYRPGADQGMNLMVSRACRYLVREPAFQEDVKLLARDTLRRLRRIR